MNKAGIIATLTASLMLASCTHLKTPPEMAEFEQYRKTREGEELKLAYPELIKHAANSFLSLKISYINAVAAICEASGADVEMVADGTPANLQRRYKARSRKGQLGTGAGRGR